MNMTVLRKIKTITSVPMQPSSNNSFITSSKTCRRIPSKVQPVGVFPAEPTGAAATAGRHREAERRQEKVSAPRVNNNGSRRNHVRHLTKTIMHAEIERKKGRRQEKRDYRCWSYEMMESFSLFPFKSF